MTPEYERYHGVVVRELVVQAGAAIQIEARDDAGRINSFCINGKTAIHIKHCSKRLPPWLFSFGDDNVAEIDRLRAIVPSMWLALVCGNDGIVAISYAEFRKITDNLEEATRFIRIDRDRKTMYRVYGNAGRLTAAKPRGVAAVISDAARSGDIAC
jgi:hypothetical protein